MLHNLIIFRSNMFLALEACMTKEWVSVYLIRDLQLIPVT